MSRLLVWNERPLRRRNPQGLLKRAVLATKCGRAILRRLQKEESREAARITAALEIAEWLLSMLESAPEG